jgi:hypothetical protein
MFSQIGSFLCELCASNAKNKKCFHQFASQLFQVFNYSSSERGCACVHNACIKVIATMFHNIDYNSAHFSTKFVPKLLVYMDPDCVRPSALVHVTSLVKDVLYPNRRKVVAPYQPIVLKALLRATRNKMMFFDDSAFKSRSQMDKRLSYLKEYGVIHDLNFSAASMSDAAHKTTVTLMFHTECVEILALCCEEVSNHVNAKLSSLLTVDTLLAVMTNVESGSVRCPPLMYSYGLYLYRVYLKDSDHCSSASLADLFSSDLMWTLVEAFCTIASASSSLHNAYRPFIFDVAIPTIETILKSVSAAQKPLGFNDVESNKKSGVIRKQMQLLLQTLLESTVTISSAERSTVEAACLYFNVSVAKRQQEGKEASVLEEGAPESLPPPAPAKPLANSYDFLGIYDSDEEPEVEFEMSSTIAKCRATREEIALHTADMIDNCETIEQIRKETSTEQLITTLMVMEMNEGEHLDSSSSVTSDRSTDNSTAGSFSPSAGSFFSALVKRLAVYVMKVISTVRNNACRKESLANVKLVFEIFTVTLQKARFKDSQSRELEDLQHLMNSNQAGQLIVEVISLAHSEGAGQQDNVALVDYALAFASEFLFNGNRQCQKSLLDLMCGDSSLRLNSFFSSISKSIKCYTEVIRSMIHSRNGIKEMDMTGDITSTASSDEHYLEVLARAQSTFLLLQLLCEGHYLDMQEVFENAEIG